MRALRTKGEIVFDFLNDCFMFFILFIMLYPFVSQIALSLSSNDAVMMGKVGLWPVGFNLGAYHEVLQDKRFLKAFSNTAIFTVFGVFMQVFMVTLFAYPLSRKKLKGRNVIMNILVFSMVFGTGGLIPNYLLMKSLNLINSFWALWLPGMINIWYMIILKNFFQQIPDSLEESAQIDGARPTRIFFQIIIPLSMPSIAAIGLFLAVGLWNTFFNALIYLSDSNKRLLQVHLNDILQAFIQSVGPDGESRSVDPNSIARDTMKAATLMCTTIPIVCVYPFLQKYFVKGVMVGALKG